MHSRGTVLLWIIFRADLRALTGTPWSYVKVPQMEFADLQPENLSELFLAFGYPRKHGPTSSTSPAWRPTAPLTWLDSLYHPITLDYVPGRVVDSR